MKMLIAVLSVAAVLAVQSCKSTSTPSAEEAPALSGLVGEATMVTIRGWIDAVDKTNRTAHLILGVRALKYKQYSPARLQFKQAERGLHRNASHQHDQEQL